MDIPNDVQIGAINYSIFKAVPPENDCEVELGHIDYATAEIYLNPDVSDDVMQSTLMHEIFHGIFHELGRYDERDNEGLVNGLAGQLTMLIKKNPALIEYMRQTVIKKESMWNFDPTAKYAGYFLGKSPEYSQESSSTNGQGTISNNR